MIIIYFTGIKNKNRVIHNYIIYIKHNFQFQKLPQSFILFFHFYYQSHTFFSNQSLFWTYLYQSVQFYSYKIINQTIPKSFTLLFFYFIFFIQNLQSIEYLMTFKEQAIETCKSIWGYAQSGTKKIFNFIGQKSRNIYEAEIVQQGIDKSKNFYQDHKKVCIGFGVALVTLAIVGIRMKKKKSNNETVKDPEVQEQQYKKPSQVVGKKSFLDELAEDDPYEDQVSTDAIRKQMIPKIRKNNQKKAKQIAQQDQREDKIFYQMYSMYKTAGQQK